MNRKLIRKYILLEMKKRLLEEEEQEAKPPLFPSVEAAQAAKDLCLQNAEIFGRGITKGNGVGLSREEANKIADELYDATEGWSLSLSDMASGKFGAAGTNEEAILAALEKIPSLADLSFVACRFQERHSGYDLADTLEDEYGTFTSDEFDDVKTKIDAIYRDKFVIFMNGEGVKRSDLEKLAAAAKKDAAAFQSASPGGLDDTWTDAVKGGVTGAGAAIGAGAATGAVIGAAATDVLGTSIFLKGLGLAKATASMGGIGAWTAGGAVAGGSAAGVTGAASGAGAGAAAMLSSNPAGWAVAALLAVGVGVYIATDNEEFNEAELKMLSCDFYKNLEKLFAELAASFRERAASINPEDYAPPEVTADDIPPLGWGLDRPYIRHIILTMNEYAKTRKLEGYTPASGDEWSPEADACWQKFAPHALENCDVFSAHKGEAGNASKWRVLSGKLISDFPAYYPNPRGCLAFCLDAYYCELRYGNATGGRGAAPVPAPSGGTRDRPPETSPTPRSGGGDRSLSKVSIRLSTTGRNFKASGFSLANGEDPDNVIKTNLINLLSKNAQNRGIAQTTLKFYAEVKNGKVVGMERMSWDGSARDWVKRKNRINAEVKTVLDAGNLQIPDGFKLNRGPKGDGPDTINFSVVFRAGSY